MTKEEAIRWLTGQLDMGDMITQEPYDTWNIRVEQANAAKLQQAYYILMAHKEGLVEGRQVCRKG